MREAAASWCLVLLALATANLPFVNERLLAVFPLRKAKSLALRALELLVWALLTLAVGMVIERWIGQRHPQRWEFYAAFAFLFLTFAFPGFVWRHLRRARGNVPIQQP